MFLGNNSLWLNHPDHASTPHPNHVPPKTFHVQTRIEMFGEDRSIVDKCLKRDDWTCIQPPDIRPGAYVHQEGIWERNGLRMILKEIDFYTYGGPYIFHYTINDIPLGHCTWGNWDHQGRLVIAKEGRLLTVQVKAGALVEDVIVDLDDDEPCPIESPEWARHW